MEVITRDYKSPIVGVVEVYTEGVLCASPGNEGIGEEEGNGGFI